MNAIENSMNKNDVQRQIQRNKQSQNLNGVEYNMHSAHLSHCTTEQTSERASATKPETSRLTRWALTLAMVVFPTWALAQSDLLMTAVGTATTVINTKGGTISVSNNIKNQGTTASTVSVRVGIYLSTDNEITTADTLLGYRTVGAVAAGASSNSTGTSVTVPAGLAPGTYYLGAIADYTALEAESDETNNVLAGPTLTVTLSDMVMTAVGSTTTQINTKGGNIYVSDTIKNQAAVASTVGVRVGYYLSTDNVITTADTLLGYRTAGAVAAGASNTVASTYVTVPAGMAPGTYYLGAIADYTGLEAETDETNNTLAGPTFAVTLSDLTMTAVGSTTTQINTKGGNIYVSDTIKNQAAVASTVNVRVGYYLSADNIITTTDTFLGYRTAGAVAAGASNTVASTYVTVPTGMAAGTYYLGTIADYTGLEAEADETNNTLAGPTFAVTLSDLVMTAVGSTTTQINTLGGPIYVSDTLKNQAAVASTVNVRVGYYLSTDDIITSADTFLGYRTAGAVAAGASNTVASTYVTVPAGLAPGTYHLGAIADYTALEAEADETNNTLTLSTLTVTLPDMVMTTVGSPAAKAASGAYMTVTDTMKNQAAVASTVGVRVGYYLSTDNVITTADTLLGYRTTGTVAAGANNANAGVSVLVPTATPPGTYYLGAIADYSELQAETDETNNTLVGPMIVIGPDLVMSAVSSPSTTVPPGATIAIADTLKNQGASATTSGCRLIGYYLSSDTAISTADTLIGSRQHCGTLAANGTNTVAATNITLPVDIAIGTYYLGAIADYTGLQAEGDETNNSLSGTTILLTLLPAAPSNVSASGGNAQATVTFTAPANNGGSAITGYTVSSQPAGGVDSNAGTTGLSHIITGLVNGTAYTFTVTAANGAGTSPASTESNSVIPKTVPGAPLIGTATGGNTQATVTFTAPASNGGAAITGYTVSSQPAGGVDSNAGTAGLSHIVTGLVNGTAYTFTVTAANAAGSGIASAASNSVTPSVAAPNPPTHVIAAGGSTQATVSFNASTDNGSPVTGYTVSSNPAGLVDSQAGTTGLSHVITGLVSGTTYTFTVTASNAVGTSAPSTPSNSVTANGNMAQAYYIHADHLDTPRQITDTAGNVVWQWDNSDPFGNNPPNENPSGQGQFTCNLRHPGQYFDIETGLFYNINRHYDPVSGRYVESDPIGLAGGINTYGYVGGNPLSNSDRLGLASSARPCPPGWICFPIPPGSQSSSSSSTGFPDLDDPSDGGSASQSKPDEQKNCPVPPEDPCKEIRKQIRDLEAQIASREAALAKDQYDLFTRAYKENPGGDLAGKGTYVGHLEKIIGLRTGLQRKIDEAKAKGCM